MKKERYWYFEKQGQIYDNEKETFLKGLISIETIVDLLNQQDARIKELEEENRRLFNLTQLNNCENCEKVAIKTNQMLIEENQQLKQSQNQKAIEELKSVKYNLLDLSNNYWRHFKTGEPFMTYDDIMLFIKKNINIQIEELRSKQ